MATFRQHLKKKASISSGCGEEDVYKPIWIFFNVMESFLGDVYECSSKMNTWVSLLKSLCNYANSIEMKYKIKIDISNETFIFT